MGKRKYFSEPEDVQYMTNDFISCMNWFLNNQVNQGHNDCFNETMVDVVKDLNVLADMNYDKVSLTARYQLVQKIRQKLKGLNEALLKTNKFYDKCVNIVWALVDYHSANSHARILYTNVISAYDAWKSIMDFVKMKQDIRNIKLLVSNLFTR